MYLKSYKVDVALANTALETAEKKALVNSTNDRFKLFANAIKNKDINYFYELEENGNVSLFNELKEDFSKNRISKEKLKDYFNKLFEDDIGSKTLNNKLRAIEPILFSDDNVKKSSGNRYYSL